VVVGEIRDWFRLAGSGWLDWFGGERDQSGGTACSQHIALLVWVYRAAIGFIVMAHYYARLMGSPIRAVRRIRLGGDRLRAVSSRAEILKKPRAHGRGAALFAGTFGPLEHPCPEVGLSAALWNSRSCSPNEGATLFPVLRQLRCGGSEFKYEFGSTI